MDRRQAAVATGALALGLLSLDSAGAPVARRQAWLGTTSAVAFGRFGADLLDQVLASGYYTWTTHREAGLAAGTRTQFVLLDPAERGATDAAMEAIYAARAADRRVFAVLKSPRAGGLKYGRIVNEFRHLKRCSDFVVTVPEPAGSSDVLWEGILAAAVAEDNEAAFYADLQTLFDPARSAVQITVGHGRGASPVQATQEAMAHPLMAGCRMGETHSVLAVLTIGGTRLSLREVDEACAVVRAAVATEAQGSIAIRFLGTKERTNQVHLVAVQRPNHRTLATSL